MQIDPDTIPVANSQVVQPIAQLIGNRVELAVGDRALARFDDRGSVRIDSGGLF